MTTDPLDLLHTAVRALGADGRFPHGPGDAARMAARLLPQLGRAVDHPEELLGPWERLPDAAQEGLRVAAEREIARVMSLHPRGRIWPGAARSLNGLAYQLRRRAGVRGVSRSVERWSGRLWKSPASLSERVRVKRGRERWIGGRTQAIDGLLAAVGRRPRWLLGDYVRGVEVDPRCRGFFRDTHRNVVWGYLIGIDLILAADGIWCVEANLDTAFNRDRRALLASEPVVPAVFDVATEMGASTVWWHGMDEGRIRPWLVQELEEEGVRRGVAVEVREDARVPSLGRPKRERPAKHLMSPTRPPRDTFVLRRNDYRVGSDYVVSNKEPFVRALQAGLEARGDRRVRAPAMTRTPTDLILSDDRGFPNLVYKYPDSSKGDGVHFMRVESPEQAVGLARELDRRFGEPPGLFQPFIRSRLLEGRRVYDVRCEMVISPLGARFCFAARRESSRPIPETLPTGLVGGADAFISNVATGGSFGALDPSEEEEVRGAAEAVGEALVTVLSRGFEVGS